jgi:hypothetical protein
VGGRSRSIAVDVALLSLTLSAHASPAVVAAASLLPAAAAPLRSPRCRLLSSSSSSSSSSCSSPQIEKNVPASVLAVGSAHAPSAAAAPTVRDQPNVALQQAPAPPAAASASASAAASRGDLRESLDDAKRVIRSRDDQAAEARQFARWMREAGVPQHVKELEGKIVLV